VKPKFDEEYQMVCGEDEEDNYIVSLVMDINEKVEGAYVISSGKNMGVFKGVGFPDEIAEFFRIDEYKAFIWTAHNRFPTNTPGWWGGAHPFTILDWSIVHNGEISSYGTNKRYLELFGYKCTLPYGY
jgi:glutamate synthase domain-containing protein 1